MQRNDRQFEDLLRMEAECERAGVFRRTVSPTPFEVALAGSQTRGGVVRWGRVALPVAASLALILGLEFLQSSKAPVEFRAPQVQIAAKNCEGADAVQYTLASFNSCITGPGKPIASGECTCADLDRDGDVDLLDFGILQRTAEVQPTS